MKKKRASAKDLLEIAKSRHARLTYDLHRAGLKTALKEFSNPQSDVFRHTLPAIVNIIENPNLFGKLDTAVHSLDEDAAVVKKKRKSDKVRGDTEKKTKTLRSAKQTEAIVDEAKHLIKHSRLFEDKANRGKADAIAAAIQKRIENKTVKKNNEILYPHQDPDQEKNRLAPSYSTIRTRVLTYIKSREYRNK